MDLRFLWVASWLTTHQARFFVKRFVGRRARRGALAGPAAHFLQAGDAFFQRRVRAEQIGHAAAAEAEQRRDDEHLLGAGVAVVHGDLPAGHAQLVQGTGQGQGLTADAGAGLVGQVFARAGDGHLDDAGGDGGQDGQQERGDGIGAAFLVAVAL